MSNYSNNFNLKLKSFVGGFDKYKNYVWRYFYSRTFSNFNLKNDLLLPKSVRYGIKYSLIKSDLRSIKNEFIIDDDIFIGFLQEFINDNRNLFESNSVINSHENELMNFFHIITEPFESVLFDLGVSFNFNTLTFEKSLDRATNEQINKISELLDDGNLLLYESCVSDFIHYNTTTKDRNFYHDSLDRLKEVLENYLNTSYSGLKLHDKKVSDILFDGTNQKLIKNNFDWIIGVIHHNGSGVHEDLTRKEWIYAWLELNKLLYLFGLYKRQSN
jgi:hypothetical protein